MPTMDMRLHFKTFWTVRACLMLLSPAMSTSEVAPVPAGRWNFAINSPGAMCDTVSRVCLTQHNASDPVKLIPGTGALFGPDRAQRLNAPREDLPKLTAIAGPNASVTVLAWLRPAQNYLKGGFVGGLWDEGDAARQYALYMGPMARCQTPAGVVGHISADGGPPADIGHLACESAACGSTTLDGSHFHCVTSTYDGTTIRAYLNGSIDNWSHPTYNSSTLNPFLYPNPPAFPVGGIYNPPANHSAADFALGANFINHGHGKVLSVGGFRGVLNTFAIWPEALTVDQIKDACKKMQPQP